jgi:hypothetical protein
MHLVQLPQRLGIEIDVDCIQPDRHDIVYAHLDGRISSLRLIRGDVLEELRKGL